MRSNLCSYDERETNYHGHKNRMYRIKKKFKFTTNVSVSKIQMLHRLLSHLSWCFTTSSKQT